MSIDYPGIRDVSAAGNFVWFASDSGLVEYELSSGDVTLIEAVPDKLLRVFTWGDGRTVWFSFTDEGQKTSGYTTGKYSLDRVDAPDFYTPHDHINAFKNQNFSRLIYSIVVDGSGDVWFGAQNKALFIYQSGNSWANIPMETDNAPDAITRLALTSEATSAAPIVWATNSSILYRWQEEAASADSDTWGLFNIQTTQNGIGLTVKDIIFDGLGNLWVAHSEGLSILPARAAQTSSKLDDKWQKCTDKNAPVPGGAALALATSEEGQVVWIATQEGVAGIRVDDPLPTDCMELKWQVWNSDDAAQGIWSGEAAFGLNELRLSTSEWAEAENHYTRIWLLGQNNNQIEIIDLK